MSPSTASIQRTKVFCFILPSSLEPCQCVWSSGPRSPRDLADTLITRTPRLYSSIVQSLIILILLRFPRYLGVWDLKVLKNPLIQPPSFWFWYPTFCHLPPTWSSELVVCYGLAYSVPLIRFLWPPIWVLSPPLPALLSHCPLSQHRCYKDSPRNPLP